MSETLDMGWIDHQQWERNWWGNCSNTYGEETKQLTYAQRMGLEIVPDLGRWPVYNLAGMSVIDLGGGPVSMLLKTKGGGRMVVVDPCGYPNWVARRYAIHGIDYVVMPAEQYRAPRWFDECWIYNVLQHVENPIAVLDTAIMVSKRLRIFDWLETEPCEGHPNTLHREELDSHLHGYGTVEELRGENGCWGLAYYGLFQL
jgi:hypothetical protein